jgi:hypothetical protein
MAARQEFQWDDAFLLEDQLTEDERMIRDTARAYAQDSCSRALSMPISQRDHRSGDFPR